MMGREVLDIYLAGRAVELKRHEDRVEFRLGSHDVLGGYAARWYAFSAGGHIFFMLELRCGRTDLGLVRERYESRPRPGAAAMITMVSNESVGMPGRGLLLLAQSTHRSSGCRVDYRTLDCILWETALQADFLFSRLSASARRRYSLDNLRALGRRLNFECEISGPSRMTYRYVPSEADGHGDDAFTASAREARDRLEELRRRLDRHGEDGTAQDGGLWSCHTGVSFEDVAGMDDLKEIVMRNVIWPMRHPEKVSEYRLTPPSGMLLTGPPGTGKTFFAKAVATEAGCAFRSVTGADIGSMYVHETSRRIHELFREARERRPAILFIDEIEGWLGRRTSAGMEKRGDEVGAFLVEMNEAASSGVFVIGATNLKDELDPAVTRHGRLDLHVEVLPPDLDQRARLFETHLRGRPSEAVDCRALAQATEGMDVVAADVAYVCNAVAMDCAIDGRPITQADLERQIAMSFGTRKASSRKIGFTSGG